MDLYEYKIRTRHESNYYVASKPIFEKGIVMIAFFF